MTTSRLRLIPASIKANTKNNRALSTGIHLPSGGYVAPGTKITAQSAANTLPLIRQKTYYRASVSGLSIDKRLRSSGQTKRVAA